MKVAILALQGAFAEHEKMFQELGVECEQLRKKEDLKKSYAALVLPGGESTVQGKLLKELDMFHQLQKQIKEGLPVFATCAGLILLAEKISNDEKRYFGTMPITVKRNAYGRQLGSFHIEKEVAGIGIYPMEYIRAPYVEEVGEGVEVLSQVAGNITGVRYQNQTGYAFHPELTKDWRIHKAFLDSL